VDLERLRASPIGSLVPISGSDQRTGENYNYFAYLPAPASAVTRARVRARTPGSSKSPDSVTGPAAAAVAT